jgi:mannose-6-phosphate isomerase-like protein (cupin superfamily)/DNA-binding XRE family transcriptional regulator
MQEELLTKRLKEIRVSKKITLEKLAKITGFSKGYLSQIENSDQPPPIYTLSRISKALGIDVADLFSRKTAIIPYQKIVVGRWNQRKPLTSRDGSSYGYMGYTYEDLAPDKKGKNMEPFIVTVGFDTKADIEKDFRHEGEEFNYVLQGTLEFFYDGQSYCVLEAGDCVYFDAEVPHSARSLGKKEAKVLIVIYSYKRL